MPILPRGVLPLGGYHFFDSSKTVSISFRSSGSPQIAAYSRIRVRTASFFRNVIKGTHTMRALVDPDEPRKRGRKVSTDRPKSQQQRVEAQSEGEPHSRG